MLNTLELPASFFLAFFGAWNASKKWFKCKFEAHKTVKFMQKLHDPPWHKIEVENPQKVARFKYITRLVAFSQHKMEQTWYSLSENLTKINTKLLSWQRSRYMEAKLIKWSDSKDTNI